MGKRYRYNAFISYRHTSPDKEIADKLQKKLENYRPPRSLSDGKRSGGWRVFRDETELPTSSDLSNDIKRALENSEFLIVICSKTTGESRWCMEEIDYFKQLHNGNNSKIITLVADGNPEEVFPPSLCNELILVTDEEGNTTYQNHVVEPLAANVSGKNLKESLKKLNTEFLRIAAPLQGCGYDNLYNREQKKKIRRIFAVGSIVLTLLLLFAVYNSAMLWQINNQRVALAAANEDLQRKTDELNLTNENLKKSNKELEDKTREAEDNLAEAEKQKKAAEDNLAEAEKQRRIAEQNLAEANRQKQIAEENLAEANRQKGIAEENLAEANRQKGIAEENANEATAQRTIAEENLAEANRQKGIAEENANEANTQRTIAEENMRIAQENEAKANEANKNLRIKNSEILANQAKIYLENDDISSAVSTALEALPKDGEDIPSNVTAEYVLATATNAYDSSDKMVNSKINLSGYVKSIEFSDDGTRLLAEDKTGTVYVIDYEKDKVIKSYTVMDLFEDPDGYIKDIVVDGNDGLVLGNGKVVSIGLKDGNVNWNYDNKDSDGFALGNKLVTNTKSNYIFLADSSSYTILTKNGEKVSSVGYYEDSNYDYNSFKDYIYMDVKGGVYVVRPESSDIHYINQKTNNIYPVEISKDDEIMCIGENEECLFINVGVSVEGATLAYNNARMICINKNDMSVKWTTNYEVEGFMYDSEYNTMFEFTHNLPDESGEYKNHSGMLVVSGTHLLCFDKQTGELYYSVNEDYDKRILYCAPNATEYSIKIATPEEFATKVYLAKNNDGKNLYDYLLYSKGYTFDKERELIAYAEEDKFALVSEDSSEVNIYHNTSFESNNIFDKYPLTNGNLKLIVDDGNGIFAALYYTYVNNEKEQHMVIYDTKNDECKADYKEKHDVSNMIFKNNKLFMFDNNGNSKVLNYSGQTLEEFNLIEKIRSASGFDESKYISIHSPYIYLSGNNIVFCISNGIYTIDISKEKAEVKKVISGSDLGDYHMNGKLISFTVDSYKDNKTRIAYFIDGDKQLSYVTGNGKEAEFVKDSISSVVNTTVGNKIAFISKEGYIGVYGNDSIAKILLPQGEVNPLSVKFTPDGKSLIAMCADGRFIKYHVDTGKQSGEYKFETEVDEYTMFEFMDNNSFYIRKNSTDNKAVVVNVNLMQKLVEVKDFAGYLNSERKIIYRRYGIDNKYETGYYNYLTTAELVEYAKGFIKR